MNGTFDWALDALGFRVTRATGAVMREAMGAAAEGNHLVLRVDLADGPWLADVGFGDGPLEPIRLVEGDFTSHGFTYNLTRVDETWWRLRNHRSGAAPSFDFSVARADEDLLAQRCAFLQSAPDSIFVQNLICFRHHSTGYDALLGRELRHVRPQGVSTRVLESADELVLVLSETFNLDVPEAASLWPKICTRHKTVRGI